jgi:two-component system NtrC family sensor kinase
MLPEEWLCYRAGVADRPPSARSPAAPLGLVNRFLSHGPDRAEALCAAWEIFSVLLFASAVVPVALSSPWPGAVFLLSLVVSWLALSTVVRLGETGIVLASAVRVLSWPLALLLLPERSDFRLWIATLTFGIMAGAMRRAIYRRELLPVPTGVPQESGATSGPEVAAWMRTRLGESAAMAGILGGHLLILFGVAFLRVGSEMLFRGWWEFLPLLAVSATLVYTLAMLVVTREIAACLRQGESAAPAAIASAVQKLRPLHKRLSWLNFALWIACIGAGILYFRSGLASFRETDALIQLGYAALFSWGIAYYQRGWDRETSAQVEMVLVRWSGIERPKEGVPRYAAYPIRERMLRDFGSPLAFAAALMLFSSINLYRTLGVGLNLDPEQAPLLALVAAFMMLVVAVGGVIARVARELARPIVQVSEAAETVAGGELTAVVPVVHGPEEVARLAVSVERMRQNLSRMIEELEQERSSLEGKVEARTAELQKALTELRDAQAALVQGERLASIGELVAGLAHEINNPLNAVAGSAEPLEQLVGDVRTMLDAYRAAERDLPPEKRQELERKRTELDLDASLDDLVGISAVVRRATDRTVRIVQNLKNFSRSTQESVPTDLKASLEETLVLLAPRLRQSCITVVSTFGELPLVVCRSGELNQVFMNLLMNAIQSLEAVSDAELAADDAREIRVETRLVGKQAEVSVSDNGGGVPAELRARIFDPFFTTKPKGQGTGLGLSISTDLVRKHGGSLHVEQANEGGARFVVRVPLLPEAPRSKSSTKPRRNA